MLSKVHYLNYSTLTPNTFSKEWLEAQCRPGALIYMDLQGSSSGRIRAISTRTLRTLSSRQA